MENSRPATSILELDHVSKSFGAVKALKDVSFQLAKGECTAIVGDNGAGKSTLVKLMSGVLRQDSGSLTLSGTPYQPHGPSDARAAGVETVYQDLALCDSLNAVENIFLGRELGRGWPRALQIPRRKQMKALVDDLVARTGVNIPPASTTVRRLSGGQRQGLAIARALAFKARLIILDEPTAALGVRETGHVEELINNVVNQQVSAVIVSHNMEQVFRVAQHVLVMRQGRLAFHRPVSETNPEEIVAFITGAATADAQAELSGGL
jgi:ABC-type sugar transport system ATPase subunit